MAANNDRNLNKLAGFSGSLRTGASLLAMGCLLAWQPALAQDDADDTEADEDNVIVVSGIRASLANSQDIKRDSDTVVDAITAEDIGALPDRSVTEALQRVPGVAINRFAGSNDPDHFSVEGSGVVVRGLNFVRGEFNGRDAFSANGGRQLGFSDVPAELLGSVIVAKNATAEMIEGGLAGTVNLNTRVPLDSRGFHWGFTAEANYGDLIEEFSPQVSGLISNTFELSNGATIGVLVGGVYSQVKSRSDGLQIPNFQTRDGAVTQGSNNSGAVTRTRIPGFNLIYTPLGGQYRIQDFDRERYGGAAAVQFESADREFLATLQFIRSDTTNAWGEYTFETGPDLSEYNTFPRTGTTYTVDEDLVFESGYITLPGTGWRSASFNGQGNGDGRIPTGGMQQSLARRQVYQETTNQDFGLNLKWSPNERWAFNFDAQYTEASTDNLDVSVFGSNFADYEMDLSGSIPEVIAHRPQTVRATWAGPIPLDTITDEGYFTSRNYTFWRAAMDHIEDSDGDEIALRGDASYNFPEDGFIQRLKAGVRWTERDQTVRYTTYNWGRLSEIWAGNNGTAVFFDEFGTDRTTFYDFDNYFRGQAHGPPGGFYYNGDLIDDYEGSSAFFRSIDQYFRTGQPGPATGQGTGWVPLASRNGAIAGTPFLPADIQDVKEQTQAAYLMMSFDNSAYADGMIFSGNVGVRWVRTELDSTGSILFQAVNASGVNPPFATFCVFPAPPANQVLPPICRDGEAAYNQRLAFGNGTTVVDVAQKTYDLFLPSLNLKFELSDEFQIRFAASRAMARPDFRYGRNFVTITGGTSPTGWRYSARAGNPYLDPAVADQFDLSGEWYFDEVGSLTFTAFYKWVDKFFYDDVRAQDFTNNGVTNTVFINTPANYTAEKGTVRGFELSYQQTYDFLPAPLDGLGFSGNYTFIRSGGVPNANIGGIENAGQASNLVAGRLPLEQLSKHNLNATLFYEKGPLSLRASYSWRSRFLLTTRDVIFPYYPIYNSATGQLDASIFFSITDNLKLAIQGTNLLNEVTKTEQQINAAGLLAPRSYFMNDRRISFGIRGSF